MKFPIFYGIRRFIIVFTRTQQFQRSFLRGTAASIQRRVLEFVELYIDSPVSPDDDVLR